MNPRALLWRLTVHIVSVMRYHPEIIILINCVLTPLLLPYFSSAGKSKKLYTAYDDEPIFNASEVSFPDIADGSLDRLRRRVMQHEQTLVFVYAPWSVQSLDAVPLFKRLSEEFDGKLGFAAINCWTPRGQCKNATQFGPYPRFVALSSVSNHVIRYNGDHTHHQLAHFVTSLITPYKVVHDVSELRSELNGHPMSALLLSPPPHPSEQFMDNLIAARLNLHQPNTNFWTIPRLLIVTNQDLVEYIWTLDAGNDLESLTADYYLLVYRWDKVFKAFSLADTASAHSMYSLLTKHTSPSVLPMTHSLLSANHVLGPVNSTNDAAALLFSTNQELALQFHTTISKYNNCKSRRRFRTCQSFTIESENDHKFCSVCSKSRIDPPVKTMDLWTKNGLGDLLWKMKIVSYYCTIDYAIFLNFCSMLQTDMNLETDSDLFASAKNKHSFDGLEKLKCSSNKTINFAFTPELGLAQGFDRGISSDRSYLFLFLRSREKVFKIHMPDMILPFKDSLEKLLLDYHFDQSAFDDFSFNLKREQFLLPKSIRNEPASTAREETSQARSRVRYLETVTTRNFDTSVLESDEDWLLLHYSTWCGACKSALHIFTQASSRLPNVTFGKINSGLEALAETHRPHKLPSIVLYPATDKNSSVVFPDHISLTVPNIVGFVRVYADYSW